MSPDRDLIAALRRAERRQESLEDAWLDAIDTSEEERDKLYQDVRQADAEAAELAARLDAMQEPTPPEVYDDLPF